MRRADDNDVRLECEQVAMVAECRTAGLVRQSEGGVVAEGADPEQLDVVERGDRVQVKRCDHAGADHAIAQFHADSSTSACTAIDRSAATQSRVASSPLPSRW